MNNLPTLKWIPSPNFSARGAAIDLIVVHDCEGSYAGAVSWFAQQKSQVSAHIVLKEDGAEATQMVDFRQKAWHACDFNSRSIGIEMGGLASRGFPDAEWQTAANVVAALLYAYELPIRWAQHGVGPGFTSHFDLGAAGGGHKDPTTDPAVWQAFVKRVQTSAAGGGFKPGWGRGSPVSAPAHQSQVTAPVGPLLSIKAAQHALNLVGLQPPLVEDGIAGPKTQAAIVRFQNAHGQFASGSFDVETVAALSALTQES